MYPETKAQVDALASHPSITPEVARKIMCENAARVYGFDVSALQPDADRVGFDI